MREWLPSHNGLMRSPFAFISEAAVKMFTHGLWPPAITITQAAKAYTNLYPAHQGRKYYVVLQSPEALLSKCIQTKSFKSML